jgi:hypothetical protein
VVWGANFKSAGRIATGFAALFDNAPQKPLHGSGNTVGQQIVALAPPGFCRQALEFLPIYRTEKPLVRPCGWR